MKKILVVDDDPNICELVGNRLKANHYEVRSASDGVEAFANVRSERPDLIVLDVSMPNMDGYQFIKEIQWQDDLRGIPILVLTARRNTREIFDALGVCRFMTKPFEPSQLLTVVEQCFN